MFCASCCVTTWPFSPPPVTPYNDAMSEQVQVIFVTAAPTRVSHARLDLLLLISCGTALGSLGKRHGIGHMCLSREDQSPATAQPKDTLRTSVLKSLKAFYDNGFRYVERAWESTITTLPSSKRIQPRPSKSRNV